jgi:hypothetical protein
MPPPVLFPADFKLPIKRARCRRDDHSVAGPRGSDENRPTGVTSKPASGVAQDVVLAGRCKRLTVCLWRNKNS